MWRNNLGNVVWVSNKYLIIVVFGLLGSSCACAETDPLQGLNAEFQKDPKAALAFVTELKNSETPAKDLVKKLGLPEEIIEGDFKEGFNLNRKVMMQMTDDDRQILIPLADGEGFNKLFDLFQMMGLPDRATIVLGSEGASFCLACELRSLRTKDGFITDRAEFSGELWKPGVEAKRPGRSTNNESELNREGLMVLYKEVPIVAPEIVHLLMR